MSRRRGRKKAARSYLVAFTDHPNGVQLMFFGWEFRKRLPIALSAFAQNGYSGFVEFDHAVDQAAVKAHVEGGGGLVGFKGARKLWVVE